jgi:hypothetical protein
MTILTIILLALLLAAWKAPAWIKEIGKIALVTGTIFTLIGFIQVAGIMHVTKDVPLSVYAAGIKVASFAIVYGLGIYLVSLIIRIIQKSRI